MRSSLAHSPCSTPLLFPASVEDYRWRAHRRLPRFLFDYIDGGAGDETTLAANIEAFRTIGIRQRVMAEVSTVDTSCIMMGGAADAPLALSPIGMAGLFRRRGETQTFRAAHHAGLPFSLSTVGVCSAAETRAAAPAGTLWFQLYMLRDRGAVRALIERAQEAGCQALIFTVDLPLAGLRRRDIRNGMASATRQAQLSRVLQTVARPAWIWDVALKGRPLGFGNLRGLAPNVVDLNGFAEWINGQFDPTATWADLEWIRAQWHGPLMLKGVMEVEDARLAAQLGAEAVLVSNHGGRQLDGAASSLTKLRPIVEALGDKCETYLDGGLRSGADLFRALAMGAKGGFIGRPWAYAMAAQGENGVTNLLQGLKREFAITMALAGVTRVGDIGLQHIEL